MKSNQTVKNPKMKYPFQIKIEQENQDTYRWTVFTPNDAVNYWVGIQQRVTFTGTSKSHEFAMKAATLIQKGLLDAVWLVLKESLKGIDSEELSSTREADSL